MKLFKKIAFLCLSLFLGMGVGYSQNNTTTNHQKQMMGGIVVGADTFPFSYLPTIFIFDDSLSQDEKARLARLRYNVSVVYPYAVAAAYIINKVDNEMETKNKKRQKKIYIKRVHKALKNAFKDKLKNLTVTQGKILVKLINRETGKEAYYIIKELRGGLRARIAQTGAFFYGNDLKAQYDPYGDDKDIERIVQHLENKTYYQYRSKLIEEKAFSDAN